MVPGRVPQARGLRVTGNGARRTFTYTQAFSAAPAELRAVWLREVWKGPLVLPGDCRVLAQGEADGRGCLRLMSGLIREQIVEVTAAGFRYRVLDESLGLNFTPWNFKFPCSFHEGRVAFAEAARAGHTEVVWTVELEPLPVVGAAACALVRLCLPLLFRNLGLGLERARAARGAGVDVDGGPS